MAGAGKFSGSYTLRPVRRQARPHGNWLIRTLKVLCGGLGNPNLELFVSDPDDPFTYTAADGRVFTIPFPFETDGATTPRAVWWIRGLAPNDFKDGAIFHDAFYEAHHLGQDVVGFDDANRLLGEMARTLGIRSWKARAIVLACKLVGPKMWNYHPDAATGEPDYQRPVAGETAK